jgi:DNA-binding SARP family transcriptional activator
MRLRLRLLGGFRATIHGVGPVRVPLRRAQMLLAYLALSPGAANSRDQLTALLWSDLPTGSAHARLRHTLFMLRQAFGRDRFEGLELTRETVRLRPSSVRVDALDFERLAALTAPEALERAASLYQGDLLLGLPAGDDAFEEWLGTQRARLRELAIGTLSKLLRHQRDAGTPDGAVRTALRLLALDPLQESVHRALMELYRDLGRRGAALRQYRVCVEVLARELGVAPEVETTALYSAIADAGRPTGPYPFATRAEPERMQRVLGESVALLHRAGAREWRRGDFTDGRTMVETALRALDSLPVSHATLERSVDLHLLLHRCLNPLGPMDSSLSHLSAADQAVSQLGDQRRQARVSLYLAEQCRSAGNLAGSAQRAQHGLSLAQDAGDPELEVEAGFHFGVTRWLQGRLRDAVVCLDSAAARAESWPFERRVGYPVVPSLVYLARALTSLGDFDRAERHAREAMAIAETTHHPLSLAEGLHALGGLYAERGDTRRAIPLLERCLSFLREHHIIHIEPPVTALLGYAHALAGDGEKAASLLSPGLRGRDGITRLVGARAAAGLVLIGDFQGARHAASSALVAAQRFGAKLAESEAILQHATVATHDSSLRWTEAERGYTRALERAATLEALPLVAHCQRGLGALYAQTSSIEKAREHLSIAATMYGGMRMEEWWHRANRELVALDGSSSGD